MSVNNSKKCSLDNPEKRINPFDWKNVAEKYLEAYEKGEG